MRKQNVRYRLLAKLSFGRDMDVDSKISKGYTLINGALKSKSRKESQAYGRSRCR